jgi:hypothetical protein
MPFPLLFVAPGRAGIAVDFDAEMVCARGARVVGLAGDLGLACEEGSPLLLPEDAGACVVP